MGAKSYYLAVREERRDLMIPDLFSIHNVQLTVCLTIVFGALAKGQAEAMSYSCHSHCSETRGVPQHLLTVISDTHKSLAF